MIRQPDTRIVARAEPPGTLTVAPGWTVTVPVHRSRPRGLTAITAFSVLGPVQRSPSRSRSARTLEFGSGTSGGRLRARGWSAGTVSEPPTSKGQVAFPAPKLRRG